MAPPLPTRYTLPGMDGAIFAPGGPAAFGQVDGDEDDEEGLDAQSRALLRLGPSIALVVPPSASEAAAAAEVEEEAARRRERRRRALATGDPRETASEEPVSGLRELPPRAKEVRAGETFSLRCRASTRGSS